MRHLFGFLCVCALGLMPLIGCETADNGGAGGTAGAGGSGWSGTSCRGLGGTDITPRCESAEDCADWRECATGACADGVCEHVAAEDGTPCGDPEAFDGSICVRGSCMPPCESAEDCEPDFEGIFAPWEARARNDCRATVCASNGFCDLPPVQDGTDCAGGTCQGGECELSGTVLPCTAQGIRNAVAAGGGPYTFDCDGPTTVLTRAEIIIDNDVSLDGEGNLIVDGLEVRSGDNVFSLPRWANAELCGLVVTGAEGESGIRSSGFLTVRNTTVSGNTHGGIRNEGSMALIGVTVADNTCHDGDCAGGIDNHGLLTMTNCTLSENQAGRQSQTGAIRNRGTVTMVNSTVSGNIYAPGEETGGIFSWADGTTTMVGSVIDADCFTEGNATVVSNGYNIESPGDTCGFDQEGDQSGVTTEELSLGDLADNGGPTETHALGEGSVAIDQIPLEGCLDQDQRGAERPQGEACDVGSVEVEPPCNSASGGCL
jgi:hypothetical protein